MDVKLLQQHQDLLSVKLTMKLKLLQEMPHESAEHHALETEIKQLLEMEMTNVTRQQMLILKMIYGQQALVV